MSLAAEKLTKTIPAQLGFLAIYNPSLGATDETVADQIVYYAAPDYQERKRRQRSVADASAQAAQDSARKKRNEQLRRIGLAQGMVEFGKSFSDGIPIDTIETEKSRIILHEIESGWWILASINLTILPKTVTTSPAKSQTPEKVESIEYSSREVKPAVLLLADLLRAHSIFLLHHAPSISALFGETKRSKFENILERYWGTFLSTWNVLMHGNPANNLYGGIKVAACGELGVGVGEEERGSGEREVLEGFVGRIDGLVDVVVSRFGDVDLNDDAQKGTSKVDPRGVSPSSPWLGSGNDPATEDGVVFLGTGALMRESLRDVSLWVEDIYRWGPSAYGVLDTSTPQSLRKTRKSRQQATKTTSLNTKEEPRERYEAKLPPQSPIQESPMTTILPMPVEDAEDHRDKTGLGGRGPSLHRGSSNTASIDSNSNNGGNFMNYLKFGYGSHWTLGSTTTKTGGHGEVLDASAASTNVGSQGNKPSSASGTNTTDTISYTSNDIIGHYLIGPIGDIENEEGDHAAKDRPNPPTSDESSDKLNGGMSSRILVIELQMQEHSRPEADTKIDVNGTDTKQPLSKYASFDPVSTSNATFEAHEDKIIKKLRVVVYVNKPFIFTFLFEPKTESLASSNLYRSLHYQLSPLMKPLLRSTTFRASKPELDTGSSHKSGSAPIYDLVWDPKLLTLNSTIPNIPDPFNLQPHTSEQLPWSRIEALNTHMQILNTYIATINEGYELERTCKTSRGWWVVWTRIPDRSATSPEFTFGLDEDPVLTAEDPFVSSGDAPLRPDTSRAASSFGSSSNLGSTQPPRGNRAYSHDEAGKYKVIFLIRRASDYTASRTSRFVSGSSNADVSGWIGAPGKLAQGIGIDTKKYIEGLLNLNR